MGPCGGVVGVHGTPWTWAHGTAGCRGSPVSEVSSLCWVEVITLPAMHLSPHPCITQYRRFKSPGQLQNKGAARRQPLMLGISIFPSNTEVRLFACGLQSCCHHYSSCSMIYLHIFLKSLTVTHLSTFLIYPGYFLEGAHLSLVGHCVAFVQVLIHRRYC